jgi:hypothetical protein
MYLPTQLSYFGVCARWSSCLAVVVVVPVGRRIVMFVPLLVLVPAMVLGQVAATVLPATGVVVSTDMVGLDPVGAALRRARPVAVVPLVMRTLRIPITLNPPIVGARPGCDVVRARCRWCANLNAEGNLRLDRRCGDEERCGDGECLKQSFHDSTLGHLVSRRVFPIAHEPSSFEPPACSKQGTGRDARGRESLCNA